MSLRSAGAWAHHRSPPQVGSRFGCGVNGCDESKKRETNTPVPNDDTLAKNEKKSSFDLGNDGVKEEPDQLETANLAGAGLAERNDEQQLSQEANALPDSPSKSNKFISRIVVMELLGIGKSSIHNYMNPKSKYFDPNFPKPVGGGRHKKLWVESEVKAYQELLMKKRPDSGGGTT